jgi:hypothetical protein
MLHVLAAASTGSFHWVSAEVLRQAAAGQEGFLRLGLCSDSHALKLARMRW